MKVELKDGFQWGTSLYSVSRAGKVRYVPSNRTAEEVQYPAIRVFVRWGNGGYATAEVLNVEAAKRLQQRFQHRTLEIGSKFDFDEFLDAGGDDLLVFMPSD